ncbi:hypothetical protein GALMADRAFT_243009 [Galerina marginata CBS 339.88]|uniref:Uncharacterized protein n=1 Tax=Galerina marginata (strain CBS 339.88) TaxID=685588 RepID=A0A067TJI1_GALM3|nr:hypothetical protein GALMADRAFT_243009 [Galerina marginata CBS 339.88]
MPALLFSLPRLSLSLSLNLKLQICLKQASLKSFQTPHLQSSPVETWAAKGIPRLEKKGQRARGEALVEGDKQVRYESSHTALLSSIHLPAHPNRRWRHFAPSSSTPPPSLSVFDDDFVVPITTSTRSVCGFFTTTLSHTSAPPTPSFPASPLKLDASVILVCHAVFRHGIIVCARRKSTSRALSVASRPRPRRPQPARRFLPPTSHPTPATAPAIPQ